MTSNPAQIATIHIHLDRSLPHALWIPIQKDERYLVTADKGFGDIRTFPPGTHHGILLLRPEEDGIRPILELLKRVLDSYNLEDLVGATTVATPRDIRLRKA
jgi:hypothetical protein